MLTDLYFKNQHRHGPESPDGSSWHTHPFTGDHVHRARNDPEATLAPAPTYPG